MTSLYLLGALAVAAGAYATAAWRLYRRASGRRLVPCPGAGVTAAIELDARRAALLLAPATEAVVRRCTLWPGRAGCAQSCCDALDLGAPAACGGDVLVRWYAGKACALCHRDIPRVEPGGLIPALLSPRGQILEWVDVPIERLFHVLDTHQPVCAGCDVLRRLRRQLAVTPPTPAA